MFDMGGIILGLRLGLHLARVRFGAGVVCLVWGFGELKFWCYLQAYLAMRLGRDLVFGFCFACEWRYRVVAGDR